MWLIAVFSVLVKRGCNACRWMLSTARATGPASAMTLCTKVLSGQRDNRENHVGKCSRAVYFLLIEA